MMKKGLLMVWMLVGMSMAVGAQCYTAADSTAVVDLLAESRAESDDTNWMLHFARQLTGIPYVGKTLEQNRQERLVVNLRQLDCTTYVETVAALALCRKNQQYDFESYCMWLQQLRYRQGRVNYVDRLHYFSSWILDNTAMGLVSEVGTPAEVFSGGQKLYVDYMSAHTGLYPMLRGRKAWIEEIRKTEASLTGRTVAFIPKNDIANTPPYWDAIHDGDILAICTNKRGLDISHIGIAVWHIDGLHLLNASQIHKRTVEEPLTLHDYMQKHPSQTGIRVVRMKME